MSHTFDTYEEIRRNMISVSYWVIFPVVGTLHWALMMCGEPLLFGVVAVVVDVAFAPLASERPAWTIGQIDYPPSFHTYNTPHQFGLICLCSSGNVSLKRDWSLSSDHGLDYDDELT